ncbi:MAG: transcription termination factor NusA [Candidatus Peribacteria bacterium]|nr:MAG: transcription termination factor NusA [Candidatus Peribacteria bacterium]
MRLDGKTIQTAIMQLVEDYKFQPMQVVEIVQQGIRSGFKKDYPEHRKGSILVNIDNEGSVHIYREWSVVDEVEDADKEKTLADAKEVREDIAVGETYLVEVTPENMELSRIAAQAASQTIKQQLKMVERERFHDKFQYKEGELLRAKVTRVMGDNVVLDIEGTAVVLPKDGQIPHRMYHVGEDIFVLLKQIGKDGAGVTLDITQSSSDYIEAILLKLVPELEEGTVEIVKIARIPGKRTKILVKSNDENVDPIGVMVGYGGDRINTVLSLLDGEKIDYIEDKNDRERLVSDVLKPAKVNHVTFDDDKVIVEMDDDQKGLAIGREAINIKLAGQIVGGRIELK